MSIADKRRAFRALHQSGCFVIPNPWNVGSARYMQGLGFKALATTSSGYAHSIGYSDGDVTRDMVLAHCREIAGATDIPVNADFEGGYADDPDEVAANVRLCVDTGVAGLSIEDYTGDDIEHALIRQREDGSYLVDGRTPIDEIHLTIGIEGIDADGNFETIAGFLVQQLRKTPEEGDIAIAHGYRFEVVDMDARRIDKILVSRCDEAAN